MESKKMLVCSNCGNSLSRGVTVSESSWSSGRISRSVRVRGDGPHYEKPIMGPIPLFWEMDDLIPDLSVSEPFDADEVGRHCVRPRRCKRCETTLGLDRRDYIDDDCFEAYPRQTMLVEESPAVRMAYAPANVFDEAIEQECRTWSQKKECANILQNLFAKLQDIDIRLVQFWQGEIDDDPLFWERHFYDQAESADSYKTKLSTLRMLMRQQVNRCDITPDEKEILMEEWNKRFEMHQKALVEAEQQKQCVKTIKELQAKVQKALRRREQLLALTPKEGWVIIPKEDWVVVNKVES